MRVGTAQDVRVVVSTNSPATMVVETMGCTAAAAFPEDLIPADCTDSRGGLFNPNTSTSWKEQGYFGVDELGAGFEANLGYYSQEAAQYGLDTLGLSFTAGSSSGPTLDNQTIVGFTTISPFYLYDLNPPPACRGKKS